MAIIHFTQTMYKSICEYLSPTKNLMESSSSSSASSSSASSSSISASLNSYPVIPFAQTESVEEEEEEGVFQGEDAEDSDSSSHNEDHDDSIDEDDVETQDQNDLNVDPESDDDTFEQNVYDMAEGWSMFMDALNAQQMPLSTFISKTLQLVKLPPAPTSTTR
jgi:hypothetical protein